MLQSTDNDPELGEQPPVPIGTIMVELTYRCHRRCAFCYLPRLYDSDSSLGVELPADALARLLRPVLRATGCNHIQLSGGEPLLRRDLLAVVDALRDLGPKLSIITDGAHLDAHLACSLFERGARELQPTLLAGSAELHDSLRGPGAFRDVTRAIATAAAAGLEVSVCMVVTKLNFAEAARVAELAFALGARGLALSRFCPVRVSGQAHTDLMPDARQVRVAAELAVATCRDLGLPLAAAVAIPRCVWENPEKPPLRVGVCSLVGPTSTVTIAPDGAVRSCSLSVQSLGNLQCESWDILAERLWNLEIAPFRRSVPKPCLGCAHFGRCLGGCRLSGYAAAADRQQSDPLAPATRGCGS